MKNLILAALLTLAFTSLHAQEPIAERNVPAEIVEDFYRRFEFADKPGWLYQQGQYYGARFTQKGQPSEVIYAEDGTWLETKEDIQYREMPDSARHYCLGKYPDYKADKVRKLSTRRYGILYEIKILGNQKQIGMRFDMHGGLIEEKEQNLEEIEVTEEKKPSLKGRMNNLLRKNSDQ